MPSVTAHATQSRYYAVACMFASTLRMASDCRNNHQYDNAPAPLVNEKHLPYTMDAGADLIHECRELSPCRKDNGIGKTRHNPLYMATSLGCASKGGPLGQ